MKKRFFWPACLILISLAVTAQQPFVFREGLASGSAHRYGRDAVYSDTFAAQLMKKDFATPAADITWFNENGVSKKWTAVTADSASVFRSPALNNGYLCLRYNAPKAMIGLLNISGHSMVYVNGESHAGDPYRYGWMDIPVKLKKGWNDIYVRTGFTGRFGGIKAQLKFPDNPIKLSKADATLPYVVKGISNDYLWAGIVCMNASDKDKKGLQVEATTAGQSLVTNLPDLNAAGLRKMPVKLPVPASPNGTVTNYQLTLREGKKVLDTLTIALQTVEAFQHQSHTFVSDIDGSVQYYAVAPQAGGPTANPSLFLSVHGAEVEAIGQARAYKPKAEGPLVAPTNRRPRGFNWEDWGRLDALEVLEIAKKVYHPNPQKIFLTGHSMGGHGSWYLGATYAGQWAAIAPSAGYPTLATYGSADGIIPTQTNSQVRQQIFRASNPSNTLALARNYKAGGVYIFHGDSDRTVSVNYAREMRKVLAEFHPDFAYKEYPGGAHWISDLSVDWPPIFEYFKIHSIPPSADVNNVDFTTASPAISSKYFWVQILQQEKSYAYSKVLLLRDTIHRAIIGTTENIHVFTIQPTAFKAGETISITLDGQNWKQVVETPEQVITLRKENGKWAIGAAPSETEKGTIRNGGLKEAFRNKMVFVYGTKGTPEENAWALQKARYDAESWYYRGNGAVDIMPDVQFVAGNYADRGVILYGNANTNVAYPGLMQGCPVSIGKGEAKIGGNTFTGDDLAAYFVWPRQGSTVASVAVIGGTGIAGMHAADANQYFAGGSGFPDFMLFSSRLLTEGEKGLKAAGYYNNQWQLGDDWSKE